MAPIPPTYDDAAVAAVAAIQRRIDDVESSQIPCLRECTDSLSRQQALHADLLADFDTLTRLIEELDDIAPDQRSPRARRDLAAVADGFRGHIVRLRKETRAALLESKRAIDASNRAELLRPPVTTPRDERITSEGKITEDALMKANEDVTHAMRRTLALMQTELERSVLSTQLLESSTAALNSTTRQHDILTALTDTSRALVAALERTDILDRLLIIAGLVFFALVSLFILKQRIFDRGIRIAFFWTRWLPASRSEKAVVDSVGKTALATMAAGAGAATVTVAAALTTSALSATIAAASLTTSSSPLPGPDPDPVPTAVVGEQSEPVPHDEL